MHLTPIQERIGIGVQQLITEGGRFAGVTRDQRHVVSDDLLQDLLQPLDVQGLEHAVFHRLLGEGMVGDRDVPDDLFLATSQFGEDSRQQVIRPETK